MESTVQYSQIFKLTYNNLLELSEKFEHII